jgi:hypothetical protein
MTSFLTTLAARGASSLSQARATRSERKRLCAELDSYSTPAERAELDAILARHTHDELQTLAQATGWRYAA